MTAVVRQLAKLCGACNRGLHTRCWEHMPAPSPSCPCGCWDDNGMLTQTALLDMMRREPVALARYIRFTAEFARTSTLDLHIRAADRKRPYSERRG